MGRVDRRHGQAHRFTLAELLDPEQVEPDMVPVKKEEVKPTADQLTLFDAGEKTEDRTEGKKVAQFRPIHYLRLKEQQEGQ